MQLLRIGGLSIVPLSAFWILSSNISYLLIVQTIAGACWAAYELAVCLLFFDAVTHKERTATVTSYNLGLAIATVAGATTGGMLLRWLGEDRSAYFALFGVSAVLRLVTVPLLYRLISHEHSRKQIKD
jgi:predicted MFS family arabinose efflux permease